MIPIAMLFFDLHTHKDCCNSEYSVFNSFTEYIPERRISWGIHPWYISSNWKKNFSHIAHHCKNTNVSAVGECGIDKMKSVADIVLQMEVFRAHATLAEEIKKPLIIHCVKGFDEVMALHKEISPTQAWIIHGFRGKPQQAQQLLKAGFYISFGVKFNTESLKATPIERLFIESDENNIGIEEIYRIVAKSKECTVAELVLSVMNNAQTCNLLP